MLHRRAEWVVRGLLACGKLPQKDRETHIQQGIKLKLHQTQSLEPKVLHSGRVWSLVCEALGHGKVEF